MNFCIMKKKKKFHPPLASSILEKMNETISYETKSEILIPFRFFTALFISILALWFVKPFLSDCLSSSVYICIYSYLLMSVLLLKVSCIWKNTIFSLKIFHLKIRFFFFSNEVG